MSKLWGFAKGGAVTGNVDAAQVLANKNAIAANASAIAANAAKISKMMRKAGDVVVPGEEVFVESPKVTNWANYTAADITVPASPTAAKMRAAGFALVMESVGSHMGAANTYNALPMSKEGRAVAKGAVAFLNKTDLGNGSASAPEYPRGLYEFSGSSYLLLYADPMSRSGVVVGTSSTFSGLPTSDLDGGPIRIGDWGFLSQDDGVNVRGIYTWAGGSFVLKVAIPAARPVLTVDEAKDATSDKAGAITGKTLAAVIASAPRAAEVTPQSVQQQPVAPIPSVTPVWQVTNADVSSLITFNSANTITGVDFYYSDPEDDTKTGVFSLPDLVTGFSPSGYYGGEARFIDATMPHGKAVKIILVKKSATSLAIVVAKPGANLTVFGKIANVQITAPAPVVVAPVTRVGRSIPTTSGIDIVQQGTEATLGGLTFRVGGASLATAKVQVRSADAAKSLTYHGWTARHGPPAGYNSQSNPNLAVEASTGGYVDLGTNTLGVTDSARWDVWTDTEAFMVRAYQRNGVIHLGVNKIN